MTPLPNLNKNNYAAITYNKTTDYYTNGNYGLIASCTQNGKRPYIRTEFEPVSNLIGKTISYSCDIKSLNNPLTVTIFQNNGTTYSVTKSYVPTNTDDTYTITTLVKDDTILLLIGIEFQENVNANASFYTDNWCLKEV